MYRMSRMTHRNVDESRIDVFHVLHAAGRMAGDSNIDIPDLTVPCVLS